MAVNPNEVATLLETLRKKTEEFNNGNSLVQEEIKKINLKLDESEKKNQEVTTKLLAKEQSELDLKEKLLVVEKKLFRMPSGMSPVEKAAEIKAFEKYVVGGKAGLDAEEQKLLRTDSDPNGGYLTPAEYVQEILKGLSDVSPMRSICRVRKTSKGSIMQPSRKNRVGSYWIGQAKPATESESNYGLEEIKLGKLSVFTKISRELLEDASFNMESEINADFLEEMEVKEGAAFVTGDGINTPEGLLTCSSLTSINSGSANAITADSLIKVDAELKKAYKPIFALNRKTLGSIRTLKDAQGRWLFTQSLSDAMPNTINGRNYIDMPDMPDEGANTFPIVFGDFLRGYTIVDATRYSMVRDALSLAEYDLIKFILMYRVGGKVVMPEAFKKIKCAT